MLSAQITTESNGSGRVMNNRKRTELSKEGRTVLLKGVVFLRLFQELDKNIPLSIANAFLLVALNEGKSLKEYANMAGMSQSTMSRHLLDLGEKKRQGGEGYGLVIRRNDPFELRKNMYRLTDKGCEFRDRIATMFIPGGTAALLNPDDPLPPAAAQDCTEDDSDA